MQNSIFPKYFVMKGFPCQISFNIMESLNVWDQQTAGESSENQLTSLLFPGHYKPL